MSAPKSPAVRAVFDGYDADKRDGLLRLRALITQTAESLGVPLSEELRWGQPAYITPKGSTLRLGVPKRGGFALFAHCQTDIIATFASVAPASYRFDGNRAVLFSDASEIVEAELEPLVRHALIYHVK